MRKTILIVGVCLVGVLAISLAVPIYYKFFAGLTRNLYQKAYFALGQRPAVQITLQVQVQDAVKDEADLVIGRLYDELSRAQITGIEISRNDPSSIEQADSLQIDLKGIPAAGQDNLVKLVRERFAGWTLTPVNSSDYRMNLAAAELAALKRATVEQTLLGIQNRISALGLAGRALHRSWDGSAAYLIDVQFASRVGGEEEFKKILTSRARLDIARVMDGPFSSKESALAAHGGAVPANAVLVSGESAAEEPWYLVSRTPVITGRDIRDARLGTDATGRPCINFVLTEDAAKRFARFTEANIGNRLAIVLDNRVRSAPVIQDRIEGNGQITGSMTQQEAFDLALALRAGSLPAGVVILGQH